MNPVDYFNGLTGQPVMVFMRHDSSSGNIPSVIEGTLRYYDVRSGLLIVKTEDGDLILDNRGARSYIKFGGKKNE